MKYLAWFFRWMLKAAVFFALLAFALNNQHDVKVHFFLGTHWTAPLVAVLLGSFALGLVAGVMGMAPRWWKRRSNADANLNGPGSRVAPPADAESAQNGH